MKKLIVLITFFSFLTIGLTNTANAEEVSPCKTITLGCPGDGTGHTVIICEDADYDAYMSLLCGASTN